MPKKNVNNLHRGQTSSADFLAQDGRLRVAKNVRFDQNVGVIKQNPIDLIRNVTELDSTKDYERVDLDVDFVTAAVESGNVVVRCFKAETGIEGTIVNERVIPFTVGSGRFSAGDEIEDDSIGATAIIQRIKHSSGSFDDADAAGNFVVRVTSGTFDGGTLTNNDTSATATASSGGAETDRTYLGTDADDIRFATVEDTVLVLHVDTAVGTLTAPSGTVKKKVADYIQLLRQWDAVVDDIYETIASGRGFPAGHYQCTSAGVKTEGNPPDFKQIPKPSQVDALYDPTTFIHRLKRVQDSPLIMLWEELPVVPRFSGGDEEGFDETSGEPIIRNRPVLKGRKVLAMSFTSGPSRLILGLDTKELIPSRSLDYFNYWERDIFVPDAADRIIEQVVIQNSGGIEFMVQSGELIFIQMGQVWAQYGARDGILVAGGEGTPYNGRVTEIGRFVSFGIPPAASPSIVVAMDANKNIRAFVYNGEEGVRSFIAIQQPVSAEIFEDFVQTTPTGMSVLGANLYVTTSEGKAWRFQGRRSDRDFSPVGSWSTVETEEVITHVWAVGDATRLLTKFEDDYSLLKLQEFEPALEAGFSFEPRLDRREAVIADSYDVSTDKTTFTIQTDGDLLNTYLFIRFELVKVRFDAGETTIIAGDIITQALDDDNNIPATTAVVDEVTVEAGSFVGNDASGVLRCHKTTRGLVTFSDGTTSDPIFKDNEDILVGGSKVAVVDEDEFEIAAIGEIHLPSDVAGKVVKYSGEFTNLAHYIGRGIESLIEFPKQWEGPTRSQIHVISTVVFFDRSTDFIVRMLEDARTFSAATDDFQFVSKITGEFFHDESPIDTDFFEVLTGASGKDLRLQILSATPGQWRISGIEFETERTDF